MGISAIFIAISFAYGQYTQALEHNREIILRCVEKESKENVSYNACMVLWKPFLAPFAPKHTGSF